MLPLSKPGHDDDAFLTALCKKRKWQCHEPTWKGAYASYEAVAGDSFQLTAAVFDPDIADAQRNLYGARRSYDFIQKIRRRTPLKCCPMCGSFHGGHVDHYLPTSDFPEFAVFSLNLVPACQHCNSDVKGDTYKGEAASERYLHPYFDTLAVQPIWQIEFQKPLSPLIAKGVSLPTLSAQDAERVTWHLNNVVGSEFDRFVSTQWAGAPEMLDTLDGNVPPLDVLIARATKALKFYERSTSVNSWGSALWRGLLADPAALVHAATPRLAE